MKNQRAFTLVELLVVIGIIAVQPVEPLTVMSFFTRLPAPVWLPAARWSPLWSGRWSSR